MKKFAKLLKLFLVPVLLIVLFVSLAAGVLRKIEKVEETKYYYFEYSLDGYEYKFREYEDRLCLVTGESEIDCYVEENTISVVVDGVKIDAIKDAELKVIRIPVAAEESGIEAELVYLTLVKGEEPVEVTEVNKIVYSDYVVNFLGLDKFEGLVGEHYFNSIFCSLAGTTFTTLAYIILKSIKKGFKPNKGKNKKRNRKDKEQESILTKIPTPTNVNPTQGKHNLKF